jgi:hypothetical protein
VLTQVSQNTNLLLDRESVNYSQEIIKNSDRSHRMGDSTKGNDRAFSRVGILFPSSQSARLWLACHFAACSFPSDSLEESEPGSQQLLSTAFCRARKKTGGAILLRTRMRMSQEGSGEQFLLCGLLVAEEVFQSFCTVLQSEELST